MTATSLAPLRATVARANARFAHLGVRCGPAPADWLPASALVASPAAVRDWLTEVCALYEMDDRQVAASFLVLGYFWYPMAGALACYLLERRLPDLALDALAQNPRGGAAFLSPHCFALPDDPAAGHPDVTVVPEEAALRALLVNQLEQHAAPLFATLRSVAPLGINAMRANYADRLASAVIWLCDELGDQDLARRETLAFLALAAPNARTGIIEVEHANRRGVFLRRAGCCLNYRLPGREKCDTCPLWPLDERITRLRRYLVDGESGS